jgi:hypothetical protein
MFVYESDINTQTWANDRDCYIRSGHVHSMHGQLYSNEVIRDPTKKFSPRAWKHGDGGMSARSTDREVRNERVVARRVNHLYTSRWLVLR